MYLLFSLLGFVTKNKPPPYYEIIRSLTNSLIRYWCITFKIRLRSESHNALPIRLWPHIWPKSKINVVFTACWNQNDSVDSLQLTRSARVSIIRALGLKNHNNITRELYYHYLVEYIILLHSGVSMVVGPRWIDTVQKRRKRPQTCKI